jgi:hypothetical protein
MRVLAYFAFSFLGIAFAQPATLGDYTYNPPPGYGTRPHGGSLEYFRIDQQKKFYCQIVLQPSQPSLGTPTQDMEAEWKAAVVTQFKIRGQATTQTLAPLSLVRGAETTDSNGNPAVTTLYVLRFPELNRYVGVVFNVPNQTAFSGCVDEAGRVAASVRMGSTGAVSKPAALSTPVGVWRRITASPPPTRYNMLSKQWEYNPAAALNQFRHVQTLTLEADGKYTSQLDAENYNRSENSRVVETGRYSIDGGTIRFQPQTLREGKAPRPAAGAKEQPIPLQPGTVPPASERRFVVGPHPNSGADPGLQLATTDGGWETYSPAN